MYKIDLLPASFGDSILISYGKESDPFHILIDGGPYFNFSNLIEGLRRSAPGIKRVELLVITHIDIDHIDGIITLLNQDTLPFEIGEVWFNGYKEIEAIEDDVLGALQGEYLSMLIKKKKLNHNGSFSKKAVVVRDYSKLPVISLDGGMELTLLSPSVAALKSLIPVWDKEIVDKTSEMSIKERWKNENRYDDVIENDDLLGGSIEEWQNANPKGDKSAANISSIAFIAKYKGKRCLFAGDATSDMLLSAINPLLLSSGLEKLPLDAWKLAHHGSKGSTLEKLMEKIDCKTILVSSDGKRYEHPDSECIAKIIKHQSPGINFYFNYRTIFNDIWDTKEWKKKYKYEVFYNSDFDGISVSL